MWNSCVFGRGWVRAKIAGGDFKLTMYGGKDLISLDLLPGLSNKSPNMYSWSNLAIVRY
jgi:hypothetical protein